MDYGGGGGGTGNQGGNQGGNHPAAGGGMDQNGGANMMMGRKFITLFLRHSIQRINFLAGGGRAGSVMMGPGLTAGGVNSGYAPPPGAQMYGGGGAAGGGGGGNQAGAAGQTGGAAGGPPGTNNQTQGPQYLLGPGEKLTNQSAYMKYQEPSFLWPPCNFVKMAFLMFDDTPNLYLNL